MHSIFVLPLLIIILIIILLIAIINKINSNHRILNEKLKIINRKIDKLAANNISAIKEKDIQSPPIVKPVEKPKTPPVTDKVKEATLEKATIKSPIDKEEKVSTNTIKTGISYTAQNKENVASNFEQAAHSKPDKKSFWQRFKENNPDLEKFIGENLINKLGVLILVLGVSYFVKYAIDKDWINEPARVGIGVLSGALIMFIANKLRKKYVAFSSVLVSGAVAVFYFTAAIAFHEYQLFNQQIAFGIMVIITLFSCLISILYNRMELAVLSLIGGFAVPFMVSTGTGNYIVLFTYIIILNIGIILLAFYKKWHLVNILAFIFTILLFGGWFFNDFNSVEPHYKGALIFAFAFYLIFIVTNIIDNVRTKAIFSKSQFIVLVASTLLFFAVGMIILNDYHPEFKGFFTTGLAILNLCFAWFLYKTFRLDKVIIYMLIGLTLTFITLAIPIQFKGNYITLFWAAEAVLLMWLAKKSRINGYRFASIIVHGLAIISLIIDWGQKYNDEVILNIIVNPIFTTGIFVVASLFAVYFLTKKERFNIMVLKQAIPISLYRKYVFRVAFVILYVVGYNETAYQAFHLIDNWASAMSICVVYHLCFSAVIALVIFKIKTRSYTKIVNTIAVINCILYALFFSNLVFQEHSAYITSTSQYQVAFYMHYVMFASIVFFGMLIYHSNKNTPVFNLFKNKWMIWIAAFLSIYIASNELLLHGLKALTTPVEINGLQNIALAKQKIIKSAYPVLWGILAFVFLIFGIKRQIKSIRIIALVLLGITIVKLFVYDINNISETGKIIAFILLGILILIISFVYQKIKVLVIDDKEEKQTTNETN